MWTVFVFIKSDFEVQADNRSAICQRADGNPVDRSIDTTQVVHIPPEGSVHDRTS